MTQIHVGIETESDRQWSYEVQVTDAQGHVHDYHVTLSFQDYDHWSRGRVSPSKVVEAAFAFLLEREPASMILSRFDCSVIRRYFPEVDRILPTMF